MFFKRLFTNLTNPQTSQSEMETTTSDNPQPELPVSLYERIAYGNAMADAEQSAQGKWRTH